ncbi:hypothetical protein ACFUIY_01615 [Streptomyces griseorubiginosus]|uniref:hypothetical protein n=1 Tax=Streptomyces griseorubiginosus TaxID=67304 RepID=UPI00363ADE92
MDDKAPRTLGWRRRSNPLRRRGDLLEARIVLTVWAVVAVGGTIAGLVTAPPDTTKADVGAGVLGALAGLAFAGAVHGA